MARYYLSLGGVIKCPNGCGFLCVCNTNAAFTLDRFDDQERNLMFAKTDFQV